MFNQFIDLFLALCFLAVGAYSVYTFALCGKWDKLMPNEILYPFGSSPDLCLDPESFLRYIRPRLLILGLLCGATAAAVILTLLSVPVPAYTGTAGFLLGVLACVLYIVSLNAAKKRFW